MVASLILAMACVLIVSLTKIAVWLKIVCLVLFGGFCIYANEKYKKESSTSFVRDVTLSDKIDELEAKVKDLEYLVESIEIIEVDDEFDER